MKTISIKNYVEWSRIAVFTLLASSLLVLRIKVTNDFYLLFLVWNLILAFIPYGISSYLKNNNAGNTWNIIGFIIGFTIWLLFLPNAPYIITDLIHISNSTGSWRVYDAILLGSFAVLGTYLGILSIYDMSSSISRLLNYRWKKLLNKLPYVFVMLSAFGIYLGRELRYNSWDILENPLLLWDDCMNLIFSPHEFLTAWLFIGGMSLFLSTCYYVYESYKKQLHED